MKRRMPPEAATTSGAADPKVPGSRMRALITAGRAPSTSASGSQSHGAETRGRGVSPRRRTRNAMRAARDGPDAPMAKSQIVGDSRTFPPVRPTASHSPQLIARQRRAKRISCRRVIEGRARFVIRRAWQSIPTPECTQSTSVRSTTLVGAAPAIARYASDERTSRSKAERSDGPEHHTWPRPRARRPGVQR